MDNPRLPPHAERIAQNRISFGRKMGFGKDRIIGLVADAIMETFAPFTATMEDYDAVKAWAANRCEEHMTKTCLLCGTIMQPCADYDFCSSECECEYTVAIGLH